MRLIVCIGIVYNKSLTAASDCHVTISNVEEAIFISLSLVNSPQISVQLIQFLTSDEEEETITLVELQLATDALLKVE